MATSQLTLADKDQRLPVIQDMQRLLAEDVPTIPLYLPTRLHIHPKGSFDAWYYTPGGVFGGYPGTLSKHAFVRGEKVGV